MSAHQDNIYKKEQQTILDMALPHIAFDGWNDNVLHAATTDAGIDPDLLPLIYPNGITDMIRVFSKTGDRKMLDALSAYNVEKMKIRERITEAVKQRILVDQPHKLAAQKTAIYFARPSKQALSLKLTWASADKIWNWAGDAATDYNHYSKRIILSGILTTTRMVWFGSDEDDLETVWAFLDRRIENVMQFEAAKPKWRKRAEKARGYFPDIWESLARFRYQSN